MPATRVTISEPAPCSSHPATITSYLALARAGFRRYATYRQAMVAATVTNTVFGFLRCYVIVAVAGGAGAVAAGYSRDRLTTFVWVGQGLIGTVLLWAPLELAERIRTGDVVCDLLRPVDQLFQEVAGDLGRAAYGALTRLVVPVAVGAVTFGLYVPRRLSTYPLAATSVVMAVVICTGCRYLVNSSAYWMLDARGPAVMWMVASTTLSGLAFPLWFLPGPAVAALRYATPVPSIVQIPLDVLVERGSPSAQWEAIALQAWWLVAVLATCRLVQHRALRRLVIQGG